MALRWMDGFDYLKTGEQARRYDSYSWVNNLVTGRDGLGKAIQPSNSTYLYKSISGNQTTLIAGMSAYFTGTGTTYPFFCFTDDQGIPNKPVLQLEFWGGGGPSQPNILVYANGAQIGQTTTSPISFGSWHWLEFKCTIDPVNGMWEVRVDESVVGGGIGVNTSTTGNPWANGFLLSNANQDNNFYDDLVILDSIGPAPYNTYLGDCRIETLYPAGVGSHTDFTSSNSNPNWQNVAEIPSDYDSSYVSSATIGAMDTYPPSAPTSSGTNVAVQVVATARKADVGSRQIAVVLRTQGVDVTGSTVSDAASDYLCYFDIFTHDGLGNIWLLPTITAGEFGFTVVS